MGQANRKDRSGDGFRQYGYLHFWPALAVLLGIYEQAADITVDTSKLDVESVAEQIISRVKVYESRS